MQGVNHLLPPSVKQLQTTVSTHFGVNPRDHAPFLLLRFSNLDGNGTLSVAWGDQSVDYDGR